jgi:hypothetical protein
MWRAILILFVFLLAGCDPGEDASRISLQKTATALTLSFQATQTAEAPMPTVANAPTVKPREPVRPPVPTVAPRPTDIPVPSETPQPTVTPVPPSETPPPAATVEGVTVGAKTGSKSAPFQLAGGAYALDYTLKDNTNSTIGCYVGYMDLVNIAFTEDSFKGHERFSSMGFMDTGTFAETSYVYNIPPGTYFVDATISSCEWSATIRRP